MKDLGLDYHGNYATEHGSKPITMNKNEVIKILTEHNKWRRGGNNMPHSPEIIGKAIDTAIEMLKQPQPLSDEEIKQKLSVIISSSNSGNEKLESILELFNHRPNEWVRVEDVKVIFKNNEGETKYIIVTVKKFINLTEDDLLELLEDTVPCISASCNSENQNYCDCGSSFEDYEIHEVLFLQTITNPTNQIT